MHIKPGCGITHPGRYFAIICFTLTVVFFAECVTIVETLWQNNQMRNRFNSSGDQHLCTLQTFDRRSKIGIPVNNSYIQVGIVIRFGVCMPICAEFPQTLALESLVFVNKFDIPAPVLDSIR